MTCLAFAVLSERGLVGTCGNIAKCEAIEPEQPGMPFVYQLTLGTLGGNNSFSVCPTLCWDDEILQVPTLKIEDPPVTDPFRGTRVEIQVASNQTDGVIWFGLHTLG